MTTFDAIRGSVVALTCGLLMLVAPVGAQAPASGLAGDVKVHGNWTIDIRDADGTLAKHVEFSNALYPGTGHLGSLLGRQSHIGYWSVTLYDQQASPCKGANPGFDECLIIEAPGTSGINGPNLFRTLTISNTGSNQSVVVLQGTATALVNGQITDVRSNFGACPSLPCTASYLALPFTYHTLPTPITVVQGQVIQVRVQISFS